MRQTIVALALAGAAFAQERELAEERFEDALRVAERELRERPLDKDLLEKRARALLGMARDAQRCGGYGAALALLERDLSHPLLAQGYADVAIWDVGERTTSWTPMVGRRVTAVNLHYIPWDEGTGSRWCPHITFYGEDGHVEVVMGDSQDGALVPSADSVAVLHPGTSLPAWVGLND